MRNLTYYLLFLAHIASIAKNYHIISLHTTPFAKNDYSRQKTTILTITFY